MKIKLVLSITALLIVIIGGYVINYDSNTFSICLANGCVITQATDKLHIIYLPNDNEEDKEIRIIRGFIEGYSVYGNIIAGYLTTEYFHELRINGMEGPADIEGYFIINNADKSVRSGLTKSQFEDIIKKEYSVNIRPFKKVAHISQLKCLVPPLLR